MRFNNLKIKYIFFYIFFFTYFSCMLVSLYASCLGFREYIHENNEHLIYVLV